MLAFLTRFNEIRNAHQTRTRVFSICSAAIVCLACSSERTRTLPGDGSDDTTGGTAGSTSTPGSSGTAGTDDASSGGNTASDSGTVANSNGTASDSGGAGGAADSDSTGSDSGGTGSDSGGAGGVANSDSGGSTTDSGGSGSGGAATSQGTGGGETTNTASGGAGGSAPTDQAPVPGADGELTILDQSFTSVELSWEPASDDLTPVSELEYRVYQSLEDDLSTLELVDDYGTALTDYVADIDTATVDIVGGVDNYLVVVVRDAAENRALYATREVPFEEAETCEVPGDCFSGTCRISYRDQDGDNYGVTSDTTGRCDESIPAGYAAVGGDCCDDGGNFGLAADIHPGQATYFEAPANICDIAWDYDCSESVEVEHETRGGACADDAEAPACPAEVISITEEHCGVRFYGCGCANAGGTCVGTCAGPGSLLGCR